MRVSRRAPSAGVAGARSKFGCGSGKMERECRARMSEEWGHIVSMKPLILNNTVLRDGHPSLAATRMTTTQMLPVVADLDNLGFGALETWGGATIDSCLRFLNENPFERLDTLEKLAPNTPHMMLLRAQNIVQYTSFPDDVVEAFVACSTRHGMDVFRIFDALNDVAVQEMA